jgi:hypothetical protein
MRRVALLTLLAALAVGGYALLARFVLHGPVTGHSLFQSVEHASGSAGRVLGGAGGRCRRRTKTATRWSCSVADREGSGGATYRVRVERGTSCWHGALASDYSEGGMPKAIHGCVYRWQWSLLDL